MSNKPPPRQMSDAHNSFHAEKRRARRDKGGKPERRKRPDISRENTTDLLFYGLHTVRHALANEARKKHTLYASTNALARLEFDPADHPSLDVVEKHPRDLDRMVGSDAVHQGAILHVDPIPPLEFAELGTTNLVLVLDQVTDPHNVGAIMRSAVAMDAGALITTSRYSPVESGVLAKSASGALDLIRHIEVRNLGDTLQELSSLGFTNIGFDSEGDRSFESAEPQKRIALVLGSEGKGLRQRTRETCDTLVRLDMPGEIKSLNVSNAAMLALYIARTKLLSA